MTVLCFLIISLNTKTGCKRDNEHNSYYYANRAVQFYPSHDLNYAI